MKYIFIIYIFCNVNIDSFFKYNFIKPRIRKLHSFLHSFLDGGTFSNNDAIC
jgi:hypothetical protein